MSSCGTEVGFLCMLQYKLGVFVPSRASDADWWHSARCQPLITSTDGDVLIKLSLMDVTLAVRDVRL